VKAQEAAGTDAASSVDDLLQVILPFAPDLLRTIGIAGSATTKDGETKPGNVQAASIGLDFIMKAISGKTGSRARDIPAALRKLREVSLAEAQPR